MKKKNTAKKSFLQIIIEHVKRKIFGSRKHSDSQTVKKSGKATELTLIDRKRLEELKRQYAGEGSKDKKPDTAQKTITFEKMYQDGICKVSKNYYKCF